MCVIEHLISLGILISRCIGIRPMYRKKIDKEMKMNVTKLMIACTVMNSIVA